MSTHIQFISAGAGSGKTHALTERLNAELSSEQVRPKAVIATTFTRLAARELKDRVRESLIKTDRIDLSEQIELAQIGTVNSVCGRLLERFAFEAGIPPGQETLDETRADFLFRRALDQVIRKDQALVERMNNTALRLSIEDWEREVKQIVDRARANNMSADAIRSFAATSSNSLLAYFPKASATFDEAGLSKAITGAISGIQNNIDKGVDSTGTTKTYLGKLKNAQIQLEQHQLPWASWASLGKSAPGAKSRDFGNPVQDASVDFGAHPKLRADILFFNQHLFDFAASSLESYQTLKSQRGLVDFVDQEQRLYLTLDNVSVQETLKGELDLLMVDEFQDTSPIQLAVFMKLAPLANKVIFVGDIKQSIYGFRGADPALMEALLSNLESLGIEEKILENSWRSRPALVNFVNGIFKATFADTLREDQITLAPKRDEIENETAVETWTLDAKNIPAQLQALVQELKVLVTNGKTVFDKNTKETRLASFRDIAILCRTNPRLTSLSSALAEENIPCRFVRSGLLETPEAILALASLRRLVDPSDVLAAAEIHTLTRCKSPEEWLPKRLKFLESDNSNYRNWTIDDFGIFERLERAQARLSFLTPVETFRLALTKADVFTTVTRWGPTEARARLRIANLNRLVEISEEYVAECELESEPATVAGLVFYFERIAKQGTDMQAPGGEDDSVQILTHHRAKGLEWPIVILLDLDAKLKSRIWGLTVIGNPSGISIETPLAGRTLRYWPGIFGKNTKDIDILDQIMAGDEATTAEQREISELQRLLYVSMTRARDCLIFAVPSKKKPSFPWAETLGVGHFWPGADNEQALSPDYFAAHKVIEAHEPVITVPKSYTPEIIQFSFEHEKIKARLSPSSFEAVSGAIITETIELGERIKTQDKYDVNKMGNALHSVIASHFMGQTATDEILKTHEMDKVISSQEALGAAERLEAFINEKFGECTLHCEYPILYQNKEGQTISGWVDLVIETETSFIIIDHKASPRQRSHWEDIALSYSGQLEAYANAFRETLNGKQIETWIHFALTGGILKIER